MKGVFIHLFFLLFSFKAYAFVELKNVLNIDERINRIESKLSSKIDEEIDKVFLKINKEIDSYSNDFNSYKIQIDQYAEFLKGEEEKIKKIFKSADEAASKFNEVKNNLEEYKKRAKQIVILILSITIFIFVLMITLLVLIYSQLHSVKRQFVKTLLDQKNQSTFSR